MRHPGQTLGDTVPEWLPSRPARTPEKASKAPVKLQHFAIARREDGSLHELGRSAMGITYKAFDTQLGSHVALKVINPAYLHDRGARERFLREARAAAHLNHPNVASVFHPGADGDTVFYAMQFIEGETLETLVKRRGPLSGQRLFIPLADMPASRHPTEHEHAPVVMRTRPPVSARSDTSILV